MSFHPPVQAIHYLLRHAVDLKACENHTELSDDLVGDILNGAGDFAREILAPINRKGDETPAVLENGVVVTAPGFKHAYAAYIESGWQGVMSPVEYGGMGLPQVVGVAVNEMLYAANMAFGLCPMLTSGAGNAILAHASQDLKQTYLAKMNSGEWSGAMNLTEPQAGSDLGSVRTKAVPNADGTYALSGQKIFITWGDHDCAENIIHLVLARLPDAPAGSKGISLFLVPKRLVSNTGNLEEYNNIKILKLEHKLGIHGSPTCVMEFDGATGWLVGGKNRGLACMFTMMNEARLFVGVQGVAIGERAFQGAVQFAGERVQGRVIDAQPGVPILGHPDVRRMLLDVKAALMGARATTMATAIAADMAQCASDPEVRAKARARAALLTPIAKAYGSDTGVWASSVSLQVFGGMGFIEETGAAQHYRDSRITPIYEGTNGIQALDLIGRKLRREGGEAMNMLISELKDILAHAKADGLDGCAYRLEAGISALEQATDRACAASEKDVLTVAVPFLELSGHVISGGLLVKSVISGRRANDPQAETMLKLVRHHANTVLSKAPALLVQIQAGAEPVFAYPVDQLADL